MIDLLLALLVGAGFAVWVGIYSGWLGAAGVGLFVTIVAYIFISRRTANRAADVTKEVERHLGAGRFDKALAELERLRPLARRQFLLGRLIDAQKGALLYAHKRDFAAARPYLERAPGRAWHARAMLAADHFRRKRFEEMREVFESAVRRNKKVAVLYASYAWCEWKRGGKDQAIEILIRGTQRLPKDEKLQKSLLSLQRGKKLKMRPYGPEWWSLHLEEPPRMTARRQRR